MKFKSTQKIVQSQIGKFKHIEKENLIFKKMQIEMWKSTLRKKKKERNKNTTPPYLHLHKSRCQVCVYRHWLLWCPIAVKTKLYILLIICGIGGKKQKKKRQK
jgi:hypothetical protein